MLITKLWPHRIGSEGP